jgi:hypothetical protein
MNEQKPKEVPKGKEYLIQDTPMNIVREPDVMYRTKPETELFDDDFKQALTTAITGDELRQYMYEVIDALPWKRKYITNNHVAAQYFTV